MVYQLRLVVFFKVQLIVKLIIEAIAIHQIAIAFFPKSITLLIAFSKNPITVKKNKIILKNS